MASCKFADKQITSKYKLSRQRGGSDGGECGDDKNGTLLIGI